MLKCRALLSGLLLCGQHLPAAAPVDLPQQLLHAQGESAGGPPSCTSATYLQLLSLAEMLTRNASCWRGPCSCSSLLTSSTLLTRPSTYTAVHEQLWPPERCMVLSRPASPSAQGPWPGPSSPSATPWSSTRSTRCWLSPICTALSPSRGTLRALTECTMLHHKRTGHVLRCWRWRDPSALSLPAQAQTLTPAANLFTLAEESSKGSPRSRLHRFPSP